MAKSFPSVLRSAIESARITPAEFSRRAEITEGYVYSILSGYFPPTGDETKLRGWAKVLGLNAEATEALCIAAHLDRSPETLRNEFIRMREALAGKRKPATRKRRT